MSVIWWRSTTKTFLVVKALRAERHLVTVSERLRFFRNLTKIFYPDVIILFFSFFASTLKQVFWFPCFSCTCLPSFFCPLRSYIYKLRYFTSRMSVQYHKNMSVCTNVMRVNCCFVFLLVLFRFLQLSCPRGPFFFVLFQESELFSVCGFFFICTVYMNGNLLSNF